MVWSVPITTDQAARLVSAGVEDERDDEHSKHLEALVAERQKRRTP